MKSSLRKLVFFLILSAMLSENYSDLSFFKPVCYSVECGQSDRDQTNEADSPFCFDNDAKDFLNWHPQPVAQLKCLSKDHPFSKEVFQLSTYSLFVWQPPKIA
jgi:hypothetical protein